MLVPWPSIKQTVPHSLASEKEAGPFWYSQVEAIDSLCNVEIYSAAEELFWVITNPLAPRMLIKVG